jgi:hypothetical protein
MSTPLLPLPLSRGWQNAERGWRFLGVKGGTKGCEVALFLWNKLEEITMNGIIYLVGLIVVIGVILSFFGLR